MERTRVLTGDESGWRQAGPKVRMATMKTLSEAMESLVRRGFTEHFGVRGDQLRGFESGTTFGSRDVIIREYERFEGVSDPDDMAILYALESSSGVRGTLVDAFGVYSNPAISAYLKGVPFAGAVDMDRPSRKTPAADVSGL